MRASLVILCLLLFFMSCRNEKANYNHGSSAKAQHSITDSFENHLAADSLCKYKAVRFYVGRINGQDFALSQETNKPTFIYQRNNGRWTVTDSIHLPLYAVNRTDLNGDHYKDLIVTYNVTSAGCNAENVSLIFDPALKKFKRNRHFDMPNISYDTVSNLVRSAWWGGVTQEQNKRTYTVSGDNLIFKDGVTYEPDEKINGGLGTIEFYKLENGKRVIIKKTTGNSRKTGAIFTAALWDTSDQ